jgi:hypothetical protein
MKDCLNCNTAIVNNFCPFCGQKSSTKRFSMKHFVIHDFIHGVFHLDKGFLYTLKELVTRPGHSVREYIQGKRVDHFNYFTGFLLLLAVGHFIGSYSQITGADLFENGKMSGFHKVAKDFAKFILLVTVPFYSLVSYTIFKKAKLNYIEHLVSNMYLMNGVLIIGLFFTSLTVFYGNIKILRLLNMFNPLLEIIYYYWFYYQFFSKFQYNKSTLIIRCIVLALVLILIKGLINFTVDEIGMAYFK